MTRITESAIEEFAIELLEKQGYQYIYAPDIAPDSDTPERSNFEDVLLKERLQSALRRINSSISLDSQAEVLRSCFKIPGLSESVD